MNIAGRANRSADWALRFGLSFSPLRQILAKFGRERAVPLLVVMVECQLIGFFVLLCHWPVLAGKFFAQFVLFLHTKDPSVLNPN